MYNEEPKINCERIRFKPLQISDTSALMSALLASSDSLAKFIPWGCDIQYWNFHGFRMHVENFIKSESDHAYIFYFREKCIGFGSIVGDSSYSELALWVRSEYQGIGIGEFIVSTLESIAFSQLKLKELHFVHDILNESSATLADKCGYKFRQVIRNGSGKEKIEIERIKISER